MSEITQELWGAIAFAAISSVVLRISWRKGYFRLPAWHEEKIPVTIGQVLISFAIYFGVIILISPFVLTFLRANFFSAPTQTNAIGLSSWGNLIISVIIAGLLASLLVKRGSRAIWKRDPHKPYAQDVAIGAVSWIISFPLVLSVSQFLDVFVYAIFHVTQLPDQVAVYFLKMTFAHPFYFLLTTLSIVVLAPFIEELIFRGFLQTFARKFMSPKNAILVSSICFSFFHFTPEQGLANIPIIGSLFVLALFLGFVYERQGSLLASISLHACFNILSVLNLYFLGGAPRGAL
ncbi:MAG: CPBP family intramembrane metalloprotease [Verrucomicrobia bacterium]|nr:CPBP family intramembrane metalloprotease [Verrucomicrobiota bacterium]